MKKLLFVCCFIYGLTCVGTDVNAQMFYHSNSGFDKTGSSTTGGGTRTPPTTTNTNTAPELYEKMVSGEIRERIKPDAAYALAQPDEVLCYGVARKSPKKRGPTLNGFAHTGNCGILNDVGLAEVQKRLLQAESYDISVSRIASCIVTPRLILRFRSGADIVDAVLSGGSCPGVSFLYGGETKEFFAKPMSDWLDTFIEAVSKDLEPVGQEEGEQKQELGVFVRKRETTAESTAQDPSPAPAPRRWGRQFD